MAKRSLLAFLPIRRFRDPPPVVAVLRLSGVIGGGGTIRRGMSDAGLAGAIEKAFKLSNLRAVALAINSPGGSPVQSALIAKRIRSLAEENDIPVYAFAEDVAASGGYWLACAADEIYAMESSIVGSIGVISAGFGFSGLLKRIGVERRVHTAGTRKGMLDPFLVENQDDVKRLEALQGDIHEAFKGHVLDRRAGRLKVAEEEIFNGEFWTGRGALDRGLIDDLGDLRTVMRAKFGERVKLRAVGGRQPWWRRGPLRSGMAGGGDGWSFADGILAAVEERLWWSRFGL
jgi:signal peptide peptidase SppA